MSQAALNTRGHEPELNGARRSNGSQLAGIIFLLMVVGTIIWGSWMVLSWMKDASHLPLSRLVVTGERHYTTNDDIRQAILSLGPPGTFMTQDVNVIQQQIERLPWIKQVSVRKQWPDELKIHVVEYVPFARWNDLLMIDSEGNSFSVPAERIGNKKMPMLYGPEGSQKDVLEGYRAVNQILAAGKFTLKTVTMSARHSWKVELDDDVRLELGRDDRTRRLQRFMELYPLLQRQAQSENKRIDYVDLRYDSGAAVGWGQAFIDQKQDIDQHKNGNQQPNQAQAKEQ
ncbi:cell division protein FtsQ [Pectobacteriaceae bacterium CE70]|uniref:Cell division protein FtsQ n=1 Tax=Serratia sp. (strain ATCC 39006) TaxID=104623 RepID=A0A2I5TGS9_SERS3|nr:MULTISPECIES: cell division protein FtsQ [Enterobacterales]WJV60513.1 cell division protein FtsQ [Pectobacteriaceae bacterium C111]WJV64820.1 cell division protein FtsQ [Pectobacteriaceae bacterium C52]WJV69106.1 cell division protein FtsQ [Pectobacteriaceae bacterium CE70]WJY13046.1 cell division protein FtsQ [Pectobacteriaceae bacterium C80]WJY17136.1 cell division protein FtsQ [Pectobacteriaceae bacterium CE90]